MGQAVTGLRFSENCTLLKSETLKKGSILKNLLLNAWGTHPEDKDDKKINERQTGTLTFVKKRQEIAFFRVISNLPAKKLRRCD